MVIQGHLSWHF